MLTNTSGPERALLVTILFRSTAYREDWPADEVAAELADLALASGVAIAGQDTVTRDRPTPNLLIGRGQAEHLQATAQGLGANVVIASCDLSSGQQRNLEEILGMKVIDRTQLILDIFAQRAHSQEGKVQVALAQHQYLLPRLMGQGILLSRLGGGIGTRGPGEQKLEVDRRRIRAQIARLQRDLALIRQRRGRARQERQLRALPIVTLVGYTNAGKTTVFNALTHAGAIVKDQAFTTLDPLSRRVELPSQQRILLNDTVGFIHALPHRLMEAFQATLEEVHEAHLLLHVLDAAHPLREQRAEAVDQVLRELGAEQTPGLLLLNKMDLVSPETARRLARQLPGAVPLSARTGQGIPQLLDRISHHLATALTPVTVLIPQTAQPWVHRLYRDGSVTARRDSDRGVLIEALVPPPLRGLLEKAGFLA